jgi:hypothetical protein
LAEKLEKLLGRIIKNVEITTLATNSVSPLFGSRVETNYCPWKYIHSGASIRYYYYYRFFGTFAVIIFVSVGILNFAVGAQLACCRPPLARAVPLMTDIQYKRCPLQA